MKTKLLIKSMLSVGFAMTCFIADARAEDQLSPFAGILTNTFILKSADVWDETGTEYPYFANHPALGAAIPETLPSILDTNGNWGAETNGLQLSLRFRRKEYVRGETVPAIVILRNLQASPKKLLLTNSEALFFHFSIQIETNEFLLEPREQPKQQDPDIFSSPSPPHGTVGLDLGARGERVAALKLNRIFDLNKAGSYRVNAQCQIFPSLTNASCFEVRSSDTEFRIVEEP